MALRHLLTRPLRGLLHAAGYDVISLEDLARIRAQESGFKPELQALIQRVSPFTMVPPVRLVTLASAVEHIVQHNVPGAILECGTWKGGCMMAVALTLQRLGAADRELVLSDLFGGGWPLPTEHDVHHGKSALEDALAARKAGIPNPPSMMYSLDEVRANVETTGYPKDRVRYVPGDVMETMPGQAPEQIALLRLDTDFYESTLHELRTLYPRLSPNGILIIDDYGDWAGSRRAVEEFLKETGLPLFLFRVDAGAVMTIKPPLG